MTKLSSLISALSFLGFTKEASIIKLAWGSEQEWRNAFKAILSGNDKVIGPTKAAMNQHDLSGTSERYKAVLNTFKEDEKNKILSALNSNMPSQDEKDGHNKHDDDDDDDKIDPDFWGTEEEAFYQDQADQDAEDNQEEIERLNYMRNRTKEEELSDAFVSKLLKRSYIEHDNLMKRRNLYDVAIKNAISVGPMFFNEVLNKSGFDVSSLETSKYLPYPKYYRSDTYKSMSEQEQNVLSDFVSLTQLDWCGPSKQLQKCITDDMVIFMKKYNINIPSEFKDKRILDVFEAIEATDWQETISKNKASGKFIEVEKSGRSPYHEGYHTYILKDLDSWKSEHDAKYASYSVPQPKRAEYDRYGKECEFFRLENFELYKGLDFPAIDLIE